MFAMIDLFPPAWSVTSSMLRLLLLAVEDVVSPFIVIDLGPIRFTVGFK